MQFITPIWLFQRWGIDIVGPLPIAQGNYQWTIVALEYFSKWIEAKPITNITARTVQKFFWQNILCRFGVPMEITVDNTKQFDNQDFRQFCHSIGTKIDFASVYHPQSNRAIERANSLIFEAVKKSLLDQKKGRWHDELPRIIWSHNTTESRATGFTPFKLLFEEEAITPEEIKFKSTRTLQSTTNKELAISKDLVHDDRLEAIQNLERYQAETKRWRDAKVKPKEFQPGDLVLLRSPMTEQVGKLESKWRVPYIVTQTSRPGAYRLADIEGKEFEHSWNADNLRKYYP